MDKIKIPNNLRGEWKSFGNIPPFGLGHSNIGALNLFVIWDL
jgi:hypothetical protein